MPRERRLIIVTGQEGAGKTTIVRALLPHVQPGAVIDAEDIGQLNPWTWDDTFKHLLWDNVAALAHNFWQAGYDTVVAGSFINDFGDYQQFRSRLDGDVSIYLVHLCASKQARDERRIARSKPSSTESRDDLDQSFPKDTTLGGTAADYRYIPINNGSLSVDQTIDQIVRKLPRDIRPE